MTAYDITFTTSIGGRMTNPVEADSLEMAVAKATTATIMELEAMTAVFGEAFGVEFGQATEGFANGLVDGDITIEIVEVTGE